MRPEEIYNQRILLSPLNWGMGHVSRCIGLIYQLQQQGNTIIIACDKSQEDVFREYLSECVYIEHEAYPFKFGGKGRFSLDLFKQFFALNRRRKRELREVEKYVVDFLVDLVVSDHRYGFRHPKVFSICVTHQLNLPLVWFEAPIQRIHRRFLKAFDLIWVMDFPDSRLAGKLSRNSGHTVVNYIGPYSRFQLYTDSEEKKNHCVLIASGPEVYARQFVTEYFAANAGEDTILIASDGIEFPQMKSVQGWKKQDQAILSAGKVISRSGYSTLMDLHFLGTSAELIPTPGQQEQIYLATLHHDSFGKR